MKRIAKYAAGYLFGVAVVAVADDMFYMHSPWNKPKFLNPFAWVK